MGLGVNSVSAIAAGLCFTLFLVLCFLSLLHKYSLFSLFIFFRVWVCVNILSSLCYILCFDSVRERIDSNDYGWHFSSSNGTTSRPWVLHRLQSSMGYISLFSTSYLLKKLALMLLWHLVFVLSFVWNVKINAGDILVFVYFSLLSLEGSIYNWWEKG